MENELVSIIIPCFNASAFISETLNSVLAQENCELEIIVVNDGSTDDSAVKILGINDSRIKYIYQSNAGVSEARNTGMASSEGSYVVFFDADDLMTPGFIETRVRALLQNEADFICGPVIKFQDNKERQTGFKGTSENITREILLYDPEVITCPSNYLFRSVFLVKNKIKFQAELSSTADKFFLLQCAQVGKTGYNSSCAPLMYRVSAQSMSHFLTKKLATDNEKYYKLLQNNALIPAEIRKKSLFLGFYILAGANQKVGRWFPAIKYGIKALSCDFFAFINKILH